jgi:hypothetical protein
VAALLLDVSMLFGLVVLGIGLVFAVDLTLTIFRNWNQRRSLRNSAAAVKRKDKENAGATTSDDSPVLVKQTAPVKGQKIQPQR